MRIRWLWLGLLFSTAAMAGAAETLLQQVANHWLGERDHWAFTQRVREYDGQQLKQERIERYDPSQRTISRWRLISIDGRRPTAGEWAGWSKRKNKKPRPAGRSIAGNFDFAGARVTEETPAFVRYALPLRNRAEWLFPVNKVELIVTIDKAGPALAQVRARIGEPFRVALGLARVLDLDLDLSMGLPAATNPADARPSGAAHAVVSKPGGRIEYFWSDFNRVTPHADFSDGAAPAKLL